MELNPKIPDYSSVDNWLVLPESINYPADIFYFIPTGYYPEEGEGPVCETDHPGARTRGMEHLMNKGSALITEGNFFAPMYREASIQCLFEDSDEARRNLIAGPIASTQAAFEYYMKYLNGGRPFVLASHSQGSMMLSIMLSTLFKNHPKYQEKMIAAYVIGYGITEEYLKANPHLKFAEGADDTGVIISYNTEAPGMTADNITLPEGSICINPISWTRGTERAPAEDSLGSCIVIRDESGQIVERRLIPHYADAAIDPKRGVVVCSTADPKYFTIPEDPEHFPMGILHNGDWSLYYFDLRKNARTRINAYLASH